MSSKQRNAEKRSERYNQILTDAERAYVMDQVANDVDTHYTHALAKIAKLNAALAQIAEDESISRSEMVAIASHALGSQSDGGADGD
jgi:hypothetical protein